MLLSLSIWVPIVGGLAVLTTGRDKNANLTRWLALIAAVAGFLVTIPLYLTALLSLPDGQPFPKTKEEILRRFVQAHEQQADHAEPLMEVVKGLQTEFLSALAVTATHAANTSIPETNARRSVAQTDDLLVKDGQLTIKLQTTDVLDALVRAPGRRGRPARRRPRPRSRPPRRSTLARWRTRPPRGRG